MPSFSGKVVIITGSSSGIGQSAAILFAKAGASLTIHGRSEEKLNETVKLIEKNGGDKTKVLIVIGEITDEKTQKSLIDKTIQKYGRLDVLVNNAGIAMKDGASPRCLENYDYVFNVNVRSPIALTELAIPHLEKTKGNVVNVSSIAAQKTVPMLPFYAMSKAALDHFARNYAVILAPQGIRVNNLSPGATDTDFTTRHGISQENYEKIKTNYVNTIPLHRFATSDEMADFLVFMASYKASFMTGQIVSVDGGSLVYSPMPTAI
uniref:Uncharacterized protein n=1 Tax=Panagrolaimus sp. JU765 TaxID=591449 RepID=A0AC34QS51_9BILA